MQNDDLEPVDFEGEDFGTMIRDLAKRKGFSQVELAKRSQVSRVQINRIFGGEATQVRPETKRKLAAALGVDLSALDGQSSIGRYRKKIQERYLVKSLAGLGFTEVQKQPLRTFYVSPVGVEKSIFTESLDHQNPLSSRAESRQRGEAEPALEFIKRHKRVVFLGSPGAGKTTLVHFLATEIAERGLDKLDLPLVVRLPEFALALKEYPNLTLLDWMISQAEEIECFDFAGPLLRKLEREPETIISLLDGLDEVPGADIWEPDNASLRSRLIDSIRGFIQRFPNQRVVVTSRISGFDETPWSELDFKRIELQGYGDEQIREVIENWAIILSSSKDEPSQKIADELTESIFENARVRQLAENPLILTIVILMCKARGYALPRRRVDLYEKVTEVFLDSWERSKRKEHGVRETSSIDLDTRELRWLVAELALAMQKAELFSAPRWFVQDHMRSTLCNRLGFDAITAKKQVDPILRFLSSRAGLLDERLPGVFAFTHRTMQEYFAAIGLIEESNIDPVHMSLTNLLRPYIYHPEWSEVVRLVAAQVSPAPAEDLLKVVVDDPDPSGRFLYRGQCLAIQCLADGATIPDRQFLQGIFESLRDLGRSVWLGITMNVFDSLDQLTGTRYEPIAQETKRAILSEASKSLSSVEYQELVFSALGPKSITLNADKEAPSALVFKQTVRAGEFEETHYFLNMPLFVNDFNLWVKQAHKWLEKESDDEGMRLAIIEQAACADFPESEADRWEKIAQLLRGFLLSRNSDEVRAKAARAIGSNKRVAIANKKELLSTLSKRNGSPKVRGACAFALQHVALLDNRIRQELVRILEDVEEDPFVRKYTVMALGESAPQFEDVAALLLDKAQALKPDFISVASIFALDSVAHLHIPLFRQWIQERSMRTFAAARVWAEKTLSGAIGWDQYLVGEVEHILCRAGKPPFEDHLPCRRILTEVVGLLSERTRRGGQSREAIICDALRPFAKKIEFAFVYGSVARNDQDQESDLDLMLIGTVSQKEIAPMIRELKAVLGREVNPTIYTMNSFRKRYQAMEPFFVDVVDNKKIFVLSNQVAAVEKEFMDELRRVEAESLD
ncbi:MAG: NACHT domain-containing protein [Planctomycetaceae bacterium]|nr:NACHT domain-containing protein [Planctomycetaceae bacterium]